MVAVMVDLDALAHDDTKIPGSQELSLCIRLLECGINEEFSVYL